MSGTAVTRLAREAYVDHLVADADALRDAFLAEPDANVLTCPGWSVRDLVEHVGQVYAHKVIALRTGEEPPDGASRRPAGRDLLEWFDESLAALVVELRTRDLDAPVWSWWPPEQTVGFWVRRMAQETVVHRYDGQHAIGQVGPIALDIARDGIDELIGWMAWDWSGDPLKGAAGQQIAVVCDPIGNPDADHSHVTVWRITLHPEQCIVRDAVEVDAGHTADEIKGADLVIAGAADELLLYLWGRTPEVPRVLGEPDVLALWRSRLDDAVR